MSAGDNVAGGAEGASWLPLKDVKVVDFSLLLPGPFATVMLADLGADVIKVEPPTGDFARHMPVAMFRMANRNKRSMALDLKHPDAAGVVARLARWADVAIEGYRAGVADRLGIGYAALSGLNPAIVYCSLSGYGQTGPERLSPGHLIVMAILISYPPLTLWLPSTMK
ncbi:MAG: CoA transferase [Hyphomicrobiaceae bacterium]|nr:CoA transferase [Hyphomicrobiaceae bacterium]